MVGQRADRDIANGVDRIQQGDIDPEQTVSLCGEHHLALAWPCKAAILDSSEPGQPQGGVLLVDLTRMFLPDKDMLLAQIQQPFHILLFDHMAPAEHRAFEILSNTGDIVT